MFAQHDSRHNERDDWLEVHIVVGFESAHRFNCVGPQNECNSRCAEPEEKQVAVYFGTRDNRSHRLAFRLENKEWHRCQDAVEESFTGNKPYVVVGVEPSEQHRIECPAESCRQCEKVAERPYPGV